MSEELSKQNGLTHRMYGECFHCKREIRVLRDESGNWVCSICFRKAEDVKEFKPDDNESLSCS